MRMDHGLLVHSLQKHITSGGSPAGPSSSLMFDQGNSPFSGRDMEMSGALAVVDKLIEDSTSVVPKKKKEKQTAGPTRRSEQLNPQSPPSMISRIVEDNQVEDSQVQVVYNIDEESLQDSDSIALGVYGFIEASREYDGHDLLSEDDKSEIENFLTSPITHEVVLRTQCGTEVLGIYIHSILFEGRMTEGYVIDAYFDLLKEMIQDNPEVHQACLFGKHFAQTLTKQAFEAERMTKLSHYMTELLDFMNECFKSYNSLSPVHYKKDVYEWVEWMKDYLANNIKEPDIVYWDVEWQRDCPKQENSS
ncbi:hypothetical protein QJS10_CPB17g00718 [Acorus calamus]|uniref:Uncharacterized protein n=1 Tax=Acorus calamus TaxID=4465 RepID=A0AAV9CUJ5_ACOCL|nr:hypothetical protein QJS10_CPB17g00718 [Acorus calamus]